LVLEPVAQTIAPGRTGSHGSGFVRTHHVGGHLCDQAPRGQALGLFHYVVHGAGNYVAFSSGNRFQADAGNFFRGFRGFEDAIGLLGYFLKFCGGGTGAKGADIYAAGAEFFGNSFGEEQVKGFGGRVYRIEWDGLERSERGDDEDVAVAERHHCWRVEARQMDYHGAVYLNHFEHFLRGNLMRIAESPEARIVDQKFHFDFLAGGEVVDLGGRFGPGEVGGENFDIYIVRGFELCGDLLEAVGSTGGQDEVRAIPSEEFREFEADAGACAGD
jgi:hypothetical protein